jgi:hypothetical protein
VGKNCQYVVIFFNVLSQCFVFVPLIYLHNVLVPFMYLTLGGCTGVGVGCGCIAGVDVVGVYTHTHTHTHTQRHIPGYQATILYQVNCFRILYVYCMYRGYRTHVVYCNSIFFLKNSINVCYMYDIHITSSRA